MGAPNLYGTLEDLIAELELLISPGHVTIDPGMVPQLVARDRAVVYVGLVEDITPAALDAYWSTWPVHVVVQSPFSSDVAFPAYSLLAEIADHFDCTGYRPGQVDLGEVMLPSLVLNVRLRTDC